MAHSRPVLRGTVVVSCLCHPCPFILALRKNRASTKDASAPVPPPSPRPAAPPYRRWAARQAGTRDGITKVRVPSCSTRGAGKGRVEKLDLPRRTGATSRRPSPARTAPVLEAIRPPQRPIEPPGRYLPAGGVGPERNDARELFPRRRPPPKLRIVRAKHERPAPRGTVRLRERRIEAVCRVLPERAQRRTEAPGAVRQLRCEQVELRHGGALTPLLVEGHAFQRLRRELVMALRDRADEQCQLLRRQVLALLGVLVGRHEPRVVAAKRHARGGVAVDGCVRGCVELGTHVVADRGGIDAARTDELAVHVVVFPAGGGLTRLLVERLALHASVRCLDVADAHGQGELGSVLRDRRLALERRL